MTAAKRPASRRSPTAGNKGQGSKWIRPTTRLAIYRRDGWRCVWCCEVVDTPNGDGLADRDYPSVSVRVACLDHIIPRSAGGNNAHGNLVTSCLACNEERGERSAFEYATSIAHSQHGASSPKATRVRVLTFDRIMRAMGTPIVRQSRKAVTP